MKNKKGVFGLNSVQAFFAIILVIGLIAYVMVTIFGTLSTSSIIPQTSASNSSNFVYTSPQSFPVGEGLISFSATGKNKTWLDFDGASDLVNVSNSYVESISFWYKNATTDWQHIVNASGTIYVNGSTGTERLYPLYEDTSRIYLGKTDSTTFLNVSIEDFRTYGVEISASQVTDLYSGGRA